MNILITGANRGIGLELTRQFAAQGETVFAAMRDPDGDAGAVKLDVTDESSIAAAVEHVRSKTGSLDVLHHSHLLTVEQSIDKQSHCSRNTGRMELCRITKQNFRSAARLHP